MLYCGCDDSNHKGRRGDEIILATFSLFNGDGKYQNFRNRVSCRPNERRKIYTEARKWMKDTIRDYRFASIDRDRAVMDSNIPWVFPTLLRDYLDSSIYDVEDIHVYIDGRLGLDNKESILAEFQDFPDMTIKPIVKGRVGRGKNKPRRLNCPKVLWAADIWANMIHRGEGGDILTHDKRVVIP